MGCSSQVWECSGESHPREPIPSLRHVCVISAVSGSLISVLAEADSSVVCSSYIVSVMMEGTVMDTCIFLMGSVQFALLPEAEDAQCLPYSNHAEIGFTLHCSGLSVIVPSY